MPTEGAPASGLSAAVGVEITEGAAKDPGGPSAAMVNRPLAVKYVTADSWLRAAAVCSDEESARCLASNLQSQEFSAKSAHTASLSHSP